MTPNSQGMGFAAGTLVHTKSGLQPIEQIQVGDWGLSKPEGGGTQAYKRVLKTFSHAPQRVVAVNYVIPGQNIEELNAKVQPIILRKLIATTGHPFWTKEQGWTAAIEMQGYGAGFFHFEDKDGDQVEFWDIGNIHISDVPNVGWHSNAMTVRTENLGFLWDYAESKLVATDVPAIDAVVYFWDSNNQEELYFKLPVYNLEVEDFHTYYVGEHGIWVHAISRERTTALARS
jgi:hypothetical protein